MLRLLVFLFCVTATPLWGLSHAVVWHQEMGESLATAGTFISPIGVDDDNYNTITLVAGIPDNTLFSITGSDLYVDSGQNLTAGTYSLIIELSNGTNSRFINPTITITSGSAIPQLRSGGNFFVAMNTNGDIYS